MIPVVPVCPPPEWSPIERLLLLHGWPESLALLGDVVQWLHQHELDGPEDLAELGDVSQLAGIGDFPNEVRLCLQRSVEAGVFHSGAQYSCSPLVCRLQRKVRAIPAWRNV